MRILSWNINGIRTLPHYHPWSTLKTLEGILPELHADIICFQEMKTSRKGLDRQTAVPQPYHSFFSFPKSKGGYSGVAVYCNPTAAVAVKAEEGLSGVLQPNPPLPLHGDDHGYVPSDLIALDAEGRALVLDFGLFVLINVYCPNDASDMRMTFKMNFNLMLHERVRILISEGREVIVLGDINIALNPIDHSEGSLEDKEKVFWNHAQREWLRNWLEPVGPMHDVIRHSWPNRKGMYTCWNPKISGRDSNYGARIDYIFVTAGLLPWIQGGDIQASVRGSDHCPIFVDLHDEITLPSGKRYSLRDALHGGLDERGNPCHDAPRLAAKHWDEYSAKQTLLHHFFVKSTIPITSRHSFGASSSRPVECEPTAICVPPKLSSLHTPDSATTACPSSLGTLRTIPSKRKTSPSMPNSVASIRKTISSSKQLKLDQTTLSSPLSSSPEGFSSSAHKSLDTNPLTMPITMSPVLVGLPTLQPRCDLVDDSDGSQTSPRSTPVGGEDPDSDSARAPSLSEAPQSLPSRSKHSNGKSNANTLTWAEILAPLKPPCCTVHGEPAKEFKVNKPGPNKNKRFFICSRPVGPGHDAGNRRRPREHVAPQYRCNFFKWASDVQREHRPQPNETTVNDSSTSASVFHFGTRAGCSSPP
ncbi:hypothetical protein BS47DRAFT_1487318 [Hydnum rufescens UP504]|uniref:DNA-(apurinic or apyrimidinic site) endonuclease n=1 Tax=Hydnum rufescens UP504 TaxID=1448309 RepID=A0A9P6ARM7_9AGAM|nr:hypothetical protein BS47DRAFT_1487318 [Hydnum rufescens UP504]